MLKTENLARLGYDEKGLVPYDDQSVTNSTVSTFSRGKPKAIEYLNKGK